MAGHSKWANIKHRKGRADAAKGKIFSRITKEIISAAKIGGADPKSNPRLRLAVQKAKVANMPNDNIERNIKKATSQDQADYNSVTYEIYGYGGVGLIVEALTDNKNRMASDIRIAINKRGGTIANPGAVTFNFDLKGMIQFPKEGTDFDALFMAATESGAEDVEEADESIIVTTDPSALYAVKEGLEERGFSSSEVEQTMIPKHFVTCNEDDGKANLALIEWLEELEDVDNVWHNMVQEG